MSSFIKLLLFICCVSVAGFAASSAQAYCGDRLVVSMRCGDGLGPDKFFAFADQVVDVKVLNERCDAEGVKQEWLRESSVPALESSKLYIARDMSTMNASEQNTNDLSIDGNAVVYHRLIDSVSGNDFTNQTPLVKGSEFFTVTTHLGTDTEAKLDVYVDGAKSYSKLITCTSSTTDDQ